VAVQAYASWKPKLALHYIKNVLKQDSVDGLAFQRYSRKDQTGQGDDILSGNSLAVVGLYHSIYGFNPLYNRFYLNLHITDELSGSRLFYNYRGKRLTIDLDTNHYSVSDNRFTISSKNDFGFFSAGDAVMYFNKNNPVFTIKAIMKNKKNLRLEIIECNPKEITWDQSSADTSFSVSYSIYGNSVLLKKGKSDGKGNLMFQQSISTKKLRIVLQK